jgi:hypothetical protein
MEGHFIKSNMLLKRNLHALSPFPIFLKWVCQNQLDNIARFPLDGRVAKPSYNSRSEHPGAVKPPVKLVSNRELMALMSDWFAPLVKASWPEVDAFGDKNPNEGHGYN